MKIKQIIYIAALGLMTACSNDITSPTNTVGEADNAIVLRAGISDGGAGVMTRAGYNPEANHSSHLAFTTGTKAALRIDGDWWKQGEDHATLISQTTTATIGTETATDSKHNSVSMSPQRYWDDYGTADPANAGDDKGRKKGLTIYGAAVNGVTTAPTVSSWTALPWALDANQTSGWSTKDLLTSNNVKKTDDEATNNPYKFDDRAAGKLLEFTHAMTKITVNLTAGAGFPGYATDPATAKFEKSLSVTLLNFNYTGTVNVETKTSTPTDDTKTNIQMHLAEGGVNNHTAKYDALVFPGNTITNTATDYVLELNADGNVYQVNGTKLYAKMTDLSHDYVLKQGVNYIINVTVNKTGIDVTATIKDWDEVSAENETPVINIAEAYGYEGNGFNKNFDFYRSTAVDGSYISGITEGNHTVVNYVAATADPEVPAHYDLATQMYWPDHSTHYFFRGIWPLVNSQDGGSQPIGPTTEQVKANSIEVANVAYKQGYYPSDLMIGIPRKDNGEYDETCKVASHDKSAGANGICATEGKIRMNFQYAMSQVIVNLTTSTGGDQVVFDGSTKVEIIGGYTAGEIKFSDESSVFSGDPADYTMHRANAGIHTSFHDAIIPQSLQDGSGNATLKFRITVKSGETFDKYETVLGIKDIKVTEGGTQKSITDWSHGKKYTYNLHITKSGIKVEATLKNWITVTADEPIWF